jgi:hypothetical protein
MTDDGGSSSPCGAGRAGIRFPADAVAIEMLNGGVIDQHGTR